MAEFERPTADYDYSDPSTQVADEPSDAPVDETPESQVYECPVDESPEESPVETVDEDTGYTPDVSAEQQPVEFPPELLEKAGQLGFRYEDIKALGTPDAVRVAIDRELMSQQQPQQQEEQQAEPEAPSFDGLKGLVDKGFDEELVNELVETFGTLSTQNEQLQQQMQQMQTNHETTLEQVNNKAAAAEAASMINWFDEKFNSLPDNYQKFVGEGKSEAISQSSSEFQTRETIAQRYVKMREDWKGWGFSGPNDAEIFDKAVQMTVGDHAKTSARNDIKSQMRKNGSQVTARPTHTQSTAADPRDAAAAFANSHKLWQNSTE